MPNTLKGGEEATMFSIEREKPPAFGSGEKKRRRSYGGVTSLMKGGRSANTTYKGKGGEDRRLF